MKLFERLITILGFASISILVWIAMYIWFPVKWFDSFNLGSTITTIQGTDTLRDSRSTINTNFSNLNTDKFELTDWYATTSAPQLVRVGTISSFLFSLATGTSATTTNFFATTASSTNLFATSFRLGNGLFGLATATSATTTNLFATTTRFSTTTVASALSIASTTANLYRKFWVGGSAGSEECSLTDGATVTFDLSQCNQGRVVLGGNRTLDITNETQAMGHTLRLVICSDGSARSISTWDTAILWPAGTAPTQTAAANKCDVYAGFVTRATGTPKVFLGQTANF